MASFDLNPALVVGPTRVGFIRYISVRDPESQEGACESLSTYIVMPDMVIV